MKNTIAAALTILVAATVSQVKADEGGYPTLSGSLTIALTKTYEEGGYPSNEDTYENVLTDTATTYRYQYKSLSKTAKITNTQFIQGLIDADYLDEESSASDWSLILVEDEYFGYEFNSYESVFAVSDEYGVVYVGNAGSGEFYGDEFPLMASRSGDSIDAESSVYTYSYVSDGEDRENTKEVGKGRVKSKELLAIFIALPYTYYEGEDSYTELSPAFMLGVNSYGFSFSYTDDYVNDSYQSSYAPTASSITGLVGTDGGLFGGPRRGYNSAIYTGSIKVAALRTVTDEGLLEGMYFAISDAYGYWEM